MDVSPDRRRTDPPPGGTRRAVRRLLLALGVLALPTASVDAQLAVVVNPAHAEDNISTDRLKRLFLGQASTFSSGGHAALALHLPSSPKFDTQLLGFRQEVVRARWMAMAFRGETTALPPEYPGADEVRKFVREHPEAIAYLPLADVDATVKVLRIDGKGPTDPGYPLR